MADNNSGLGTDATPGKNLVGDGSDLEIADANDIFFAQRDDDGEPMPVKQRVPGRNQAVRTIPPTEGFYNEYLNPAPKDDNAKAAEMMTEGFPDLDVTEDDIENGMLMFGFETAVTVLKRAGGYDMYSALEEQREEQNMKQIETMMDAFGVDSDEDMTPAEFMQQLNEVDMDDMREAAEGNAPNEGEFVGGPARPNDN